MNALFRLLSVIGLVVGFGAALLWRWAQVQVHPSVPVISGFAGGPGPGFEDHYPPQYGWWPTLLIFPATGLLIGAISGILLKRSGLALTRKPVTRSDSSAPSPGKEDGALSVND